MKKASCGAFSLLDLYVVVAIVTLCGTILFRAATEESRQLFHRSILLRLISERSPGNYTLLHSELLNAPVLDSEWVGLRVFSQLSISEV